MDARHTKGLQPATLNGRLTPISTTTSLSPSIYLSLLHTQTHTPRPFISSTTLCYTKISLLCFPPLSHSHPRQQRPRGHGRIGRPKGEPAPVHPLQHRQGRALHRRRRVEGQVGAGPNDGAPLGEQVGVRLAEHLFLGHLGSIWFDSHSKAKRSREKEIKA